jgi:hypothetical protein
MGASRLHADLPIGVRIRLEWRVRSGVAGRGFQFDPERFGDARQVFPIMIPMPLAGSARPAANSNAGIGLFYSSNNGFSHADPNHRSARAIPLGGAKRTGREWWLDARRVS